MAYKPLLILPLKVGVWRCNRNFSLREKILRPQGAEYGVAMAASEIKEKTIFSLYFARFNQLSHAQI